MKLRVNKTVGAIAAAGLAMVAIGATMAPASADPIGAPTYRALAGVGSDTTYNVMNGLSEVVTIGGVKQIASYDPIPSTSLITPKNPATNPNCQNLTRPNGSSAGRTALLNALTPGNPINGCYDWGRSSSLNIAPVASATGGLTYVPFGVDAFTYAVAKDSGIPRDLALDDVKAIYRCEVPGIKPYIPQSGSGTRQYWLQQMGITEAQVANTYTCIKDTKNGTIIQEHDGRVLTSGDEIAPYSIANFVAQGAGVQADLRGIADLANLDGKVALQAGDTVSLKRDVYNMVPTTKLGTAPWSTVFVGSNSLVCQNTATIQKFGYGAAANCGDTSLQTPLS
jgi:ABC-type phosphate transport system substrate-binding protein